MRNCQVCGHRGKKVIHNDYDSVTCCLFECTSCGHWYVDALDWSQDVLDKYYKTEYRTDDADKSDVRLNMLAEFIAGIADDVLDIGGMDGELQRRIKERGVKSVSVAGVGDVIRPAECVVLSHTLEHIYNIGALFDRIQCQTLVIEGPVHYGYAPPLEYDYHWQHINKFRPNDLERIIAQKGFLMTTWQELDNYREYRVGRLAAAYAGR